MTDEDSGGGGSGGTQGSRVGLAVLAVLGAFLVLPGVCGLVFTVGALGSINDPYAQAVFVFSVPSIVVGGLGLWLLIWAVKKYRRRVG